MRPPLLLALGIAACGQQIEGPAPTLSAAVNELLPGRQPATVCNAQGDAERGWLVDLIGTGFSPLPLNTIAGAQGLSMPTVTLSGPEELVLPEQRVLFADPSRLPLAMPTRHTAAPRQLAPGNYSIAVQNPNGRATSLASALTVVPPPAIASVNVPAGGTSPGGPFLCNDQPQTLLIDGSGFRANLGVSFVGALDLPAARITLGPGQRVAAAMPQNSFTAAQTGARGTTYTVRISNEEGCVAPYAGDARGLGITDVKVLAQCLSLGTIAVNPTAGAQGANRGVELLLTGNVSGNQVQFSPGPGHEALIIAPLKSNPAQPVAIPLSLITYVSPTRLLAVVPVCSGPAAVTPGDPGPAGCPNGIVPGGGYAIYVSDPNGGVGSVPAAQGYSVTP
jgi:hypothetical protein